MRPFPRRGSRATRSAIQSHPRREQRAGGRAILEIRARRSSDAVCGYSCGADRSRKSAHLAGGSYFPAGSCAKIHNSSSRSHSREIQMTPADPIRSSCHFYRVTYTTNVRILRTKSHGTMIGTPSSRHHATDEESARERAMMVMCTERAARVAIRQRSAHDWLLGGSSRAAEIRKPRRRAVTSPGRRPITAEAGSRPRRPLLRRRRRRSVFCFAAAAEQAARDARGAMREHV